MSNSYAGDPRAGGYGTSDDLVDLEPVVVPTVPGSGTTASGESGTSDSGGASGAKAKAGAAKDEAADVAKGAADAGKHLAGVAKEQAGTVASEAKTQAKNLFSDARSQVSEQAAGQQKRAASGIRQLSDQLNDMASGSESGTASNLVGEAASRLGGVASWLDDRDPGSLLQEVKDFAARRPGTFIAIAAVAGVVAGRLTRSVVGAASDEKEAASAADEVAPLAGTGSSYTSTAGDLTGTVDPEYGINEYGTGLGGTAIGDVRP